MEGARNLVMEDLMEVMEVMARNLDLVDILLLLLIGGSHRVQVIVNFRKKAQVDPTTGQD